MDFDERIKLFIVINSNLTHACLGNNLTAAPV
jgi:hypothetical protein